MGGLTLNPTSNELQLGATGAGGPAIARCQCCKGWRGTPPEYIYVTFSGIGACTVGETTGTGTILNGNVYACAFDTDSCDAEYIVLGNSYHRCQWVYEDANAKVTFKQYTSGSHSESWNASVEDVQISVSAATYGDNGLGTYAFRNAFNYHNYSKLIPPCGTDFPSLNEVGGCVYNDSYLLRHGYGGYASWRIDEYEPWITMQTWAVGDIVVNYGVFYIYTSEEEYNNSEPGVSADWQTYWDYAPECSPPVQWVGGSSPLVNNPTYTNPAAVFYHAHTWVSNNDVWYRATVGHFALSTNEPGAGVNWASYWAVLP